MRHPRVRYPNRDFPKKSRSQEPSAYLPPSRYAIVLDVTLTPFFDMSTASFQGHEAVPTLNRWIEVVALLTKRGFVYYLFLPRSWLSQWIRYPLRSLPLADEPCLIVSDHVIAPIWLISPGSIQQTELSSRFEIDFYCGLEVCEYRTVYHL